MQDSKRLELMGNGLAWENVTKAKTNSAGHALLEIAPRIEAMEGENDRLRRFAQKMLEGWPEDFGDVDGFTIQDAAVECGLLVGETRHAPCEDGCNCASYHGDMSDGVTCYRRTALLMGPNAEVRGDAPLYGAASISTDGLGAVSPAPAFEGNKK